MGANDHLKEGWLKWAEPDDSMYREPATLFVPGGPGSARPTGPEPASVHETAVAKLARLDAVLRGMPLPIAPEPDEA